MGDLPAGSSCEVPELKSLRILRQNPRSRNGSPGKGEVQAALAPYWREWKRQPQKATVVLRKLAEEETSFAILVLDCMGRSAVETNIRHWNPVIFELSKTDEWQRSLELLLVAMHSEVPPDMLSFSSICNAASRVEAWQLALDALGEMSEHQLQPDERIYNIVASSCKSHWALALSLLDRMKTVGLVPDAISFSTVCSTLNDVAWRTAVALLETGRDHNVEMDVTNYGATMDGLGQANWLRAMSLLVEMSRGLVQLNQPAFNAALGSVASCQWSRALGWLRQLKVPVNQVSLSTALSALARVQSWKASMVLMRDFVQKRLRLNSITCNSGLGATQRAWRQSQVQLAAMQHSKLRTDTVTLNSLVTTWHWQRAFTSLQQMQSQQVRCDQCSHNALISLCDVWLQWARALQWIHLSSLDEIASSAAISACDKGRKWEMALALFSTFQCYRVPQNEFSQCALISACEVRWPCAVSLWHQWCFEDGPTLARNSAIRSVATSSWTMACWMLVGETSSSSATSLQAAINACDDAGCTGLIPALMFSLSETSISMRQLAKRRD